MIKYLYKVLYVPKDNFIKRKGSDYMGNANDFKIYLGLELAKNASSTLQSEISKLNKNGVKLKIEIDEKSLKTITDAISGLGTQFGNITKMTQQVTTASKTMGKEVANSLNGGVEKAKGLTNRLKQLTEEYREGAITAKQYTDVVGGMLTTGNGNWFKGAKTDLGLEGLGDYLTLIGKIQGTIATIQPIGELVNTTSTSVVKGDMVELVREVSMYKDEMGRVQTITSLVNKDTGNLVATQQTLQSKEEYRKNTLESQRTAIEKMKQTYEEMSKFATTGIGGKTVNSSEAEAYTTALEKAKGLIGEIETLQSNDVIIEKEKLNLINEQFGVLKGIQSTSKNSDTMSSSLEKQRTAIEKIRQEFQQLSKFSVSGIKLGVMDDKQGTEMINSVKEAMKTIKTMNAEIKQGNLLSQTDINLLKEKQSALQIIQAEKQKEINLNKEIAKQTATHNAKVGGYNNQLTATNHKYSNVVNPDDSKAIQALIDEFAKLNPMIDGYKGKVLEMTNAMNLYKANLASQTQYNNTQISQLKQLQTAQDNLNKTNRNNAGFVDEASSQQIQNTINKLLEMNHSGKSLKEELVQLGSAITVFGQKSVEASKQGASAIREENKVYKYKQEMLVKLQALEQKFNANLMDTTGIQQARIQLQALGTTGNNVDREIVDMTANFGRLNNQLRATTGSFNSVGTSFRSILQMATGFYGLYSVFGYIRQGMRSMVTEVTTLDDAMTNLNRVTNETQATYDKFKNMAMQTVSEIGGSATELVNSTTEFSKLGFSFQEASDLAVSASKYATTGWLEMSEATDALSASYTVFAGETDKVIGKVVDATTIIDLYNSVGRKLPSCTVMCNVDISNC